MVIIIIGPNALENNCYFKISSLFFLRVDVIKIIEIANSLFKDTPE